MAFFERFRKTEFSKLPEVRDALVARDDARVSYERSLAETENLDLAREKAGLEVESELLETKPATEEGRVRAVQITERIKEIDRIIETAKDEAEKRIRTQMSS